MTLKINVTAFSKVIITCQEIYVLGTAIVAVAVTDVNDNAPEFQPEIPIGKGREAMEPYSEILLSLAPVTSDADMPPNQGPYTYQLLDNMDTLDVGLTSGLVQAKVKLDREKTSSYQARIRVMDNGNTKMTSTLTFKILVQDVNDEPSFPRPLDIVMYVYDGQFSGGMIANVKPLDADEVGDYRCNFVQGDNVLFSFGEQCELHMASWSNTLPQSYNLNITGTDGIHNSVNYPVHVQTKTFDKTAVENSIVLKITNISSEDFMSRYTSLLNSLGNAFGPTAEILPFTVTSNDDAIDLYVAVKQDGRYKDHGTLAMLLLNHEEELKRTTGGKLIIDASICSSSPCLNGGSCDSIIDIYDDDYISVDSSRIILVSPRTHQTVRCTCTTDFTGARCETPLYTCQENYCRNNGICISHSGGDFTCKCQPGWTGRTCESDINECRDSICKNGGTCTNNEGSFRCNCQQGYEGPTCETDTNVCRSSPCLNGGLCEPQGDTYTCHCTFSSWGHNCETASKGFQELSYLELDSDMLQQKDISITLQFATVQKRALLVYSSSQNGHFLALQIIDGNVLFAMSTEIGRNLEVTSLKYVSDGLWHRVQVNRNSQVSDITV